MSICRRQDVPVRHRAWMDTVKAYESQGNGKAVMH